jgi:hypothetical protein
MNSFKDEHIEPVEPKPTPKRGKLADLAENGLRIGDFKSLLPYVFFLALLAAIHIYNSNQTIKLVREADALSKEIKEARAEYISVKSELMYKSKQSQVSKRLENTGLKELKQPPFKIIEREEDRDEH